MKKNSVLILIIPDFEFYAWINACFNKEAYKGILKLKRKDDKTFKDV